MNEEKIPKFFLIAGGTGRQGGAVVEALLQDAITPILPNYIYVITRNVKGAAAVRLAQRGVNLVPGSLDKVEAIFRHLENCGVDLKTTAAFLAQAHGPTELDDARGFITAAANAETRIQYFVYSSVDRGGKDLSDKDPSYCKTFLDKYHIEKHLISVVADAGAMDYTILRPTWFAENSAWGFPGRLCMVGWRDTMNGKRLQVTVSKDLGRWAAEALLRPDNAGIRNEAVSIASDELSFTEVDEIFRQETGQPVAVTYGWPARFIIWAVRDLHTMFGFINERDYGADIERLSKTVEPTSFRTWVQGLDHVGKSG